MRVELVDANFINRWLVERHYLHRPVIRSKLVGHGVFVADQLVGGVLWATPHFTKKAGLFGYPGLLDKWEVLMLARFWLADGSGLVASQVLAESVGRGNGRGSHRRGWRLQEDWCRLHPPRFPANPYVPRLLISWSDTQWGHSGTIYRASGWEHWDDTRCNSRRSDQMAPRVDDGDKKCWIMRLGPNPRAERLGLGLFGAIKK